MGWYARAGNHASLRESRAPLHLFDKSCVEVREFNIQLEVIMTVHRRPLRRSRDNRMIAGVCGGLEEFFGISAFWFRLAFLIALIPGGVPGILVYGLMWLVVPSE
jgi:phage shock protein PspC (stress-responsive transcriptional regulator)